MALALHRALLNHRRRRRPRQAPSHQLFGDAPQIVQAHVDDKPVAALGQAPPIHPGTDLVDFLVAGHKGDAGSGLAVGHGDAHIGGGGDAGRHPRHHLRLHPMAGQMGRFFAAAAKQKGITAFESHDALVAPGELHQHRIGAGLGHRMVAPALAHKMEFTALCHQIQQLLGHEGVVDEGIALLQQPMGLQGEQLGIAGARPHQIHLAQWVGDHGVAARHGRAPKLVRRNSRTSSC